MRQKKDNIIISNDLNNLTPRFYTSIFLNDKQRVR